LTEQEREEWIADYWYHGGPNAFELEMVRLINEFRATEGLPPLEICETAMMAARFYVQTKVNLGLPLGHTVGPYGGSRGTVRAFTGGATGSGVNGGSSGHGNTPEGHVNRWINSPGHRNGLLSYGPRYSGGTPYFYIGIGVFWNGGRGFAYMTFNW
jgi:uncharacterized protein YkwD